MTARNSSYRPADTTVMILAAGHGKRMLPLTANTPKPLLKVGGTSLIEHHLSRLSSAGFRHIVVNLAYLGEQIEAQLGSGEQFGLHIEYSDESASGALETAGGIVNALAMIESDPFLVVNGDIYTDFAFESALKPLNGEGRIILAKNPKHNLKGDFGIQGEGLATRDSQQLAYTFCGIALYRRSLFSELDAGCKALAPILFKAVSDQSLEAKVHDGVWHDVGTPARLQELNQSLASKN